MLVIKTNKTQIKSDYTGTPDKVIPRKEKICKGSEISFSVFDGWVDRPIYKDLSEIDQTDLIEYNEAGHIYVYLPFHTNADYMGIMKYKVIGATYKKSDKKVRLIVEDNYSFTSGKTQLIKYFVIDKDMAIDCGDVYKPTSEAYQKANIGEEYTGYRRSKWSKLDPNDYKNLFSRVYTSQF